jgi:DNA-binding beta-propeller fold protein YncE
LPGIVRFDGRTGAVREVFANAPDLWVLTIGPQLDVFAYRRTSNEILRFDASGRLVGAFVSRVVVDDLTFGPDGNLYVAGGDLATMTGGVLRFDGRTGAPMGTFVSVGGRSPRIAFGPDRNLYVSGADPDYVLRFDGTTGAPLGRFANVVNPTDLDFGADGDLYVSDIYTQSVLRFDGRTGAPLGTFALVGGPLNLAIGTLDPMQPVSTAPIPATTPVSIGLLSALVFAVAAYGLGLHRMS